MPGLSLSVRKVSMGDLGGRTIVILEARMASELAGLVERHGGKPLQAPAMREVPLPNGEAVSGLLQAVNAGHIDTFVFLTGVGVQALLAEADALGQREHLLAALRRSTVVCRGPKPLAVLRNQGVPVALVAPEPHTSQDLLRAIQEARWDLRGRRVALQHYGADNSYLREGLERMGAKVLDVILYQWALPKDVAPLKEAIQALLQARAEAVAFTSQPQVQNLFIVAESLGLKEALRKALATRVVAAVGPVCVRALEQEGVVAHVVPPHPKMGHLVKALAEYWSKAHPEHPA